MSRDRRTKQQKLNSWPSPPRSCARVLGLRVQLNRRNGCVIEEKNIRRRDTVAIEDSLLIARPAAVFQSRNRGGTFNG
jgi:hypothetical protein